MQPINACLLISQLMALLTTHKGAWCRFRQLYPRLLSLRHINSSFAVMATPGDYFPCWQGAMLPPQTLPDSCILPTLAGQRQPFVVALDGPAASGKGTISKRLAAELHLAHLDTGLLYRGVGWEALAAGIDLADEQALADLAAKLNLADLAGNKQLRSDEAAVAASKVSVLPAVRAALLQAQRQFAAAPGAGFKGAVLDGRDVGTVICPDAAVKLFVTADVQVRAQRRLEELLGRGESTSFEAVLADMKARDERDMQRATAPLKPAEDAVILDTTSMSIEEAYQQALATVTAAQKQQQ